MKIMNDDNNFHQYDNGEFLKKEIQSEKKERNKKHTKQFYYNFGFATQRSCKSVKLSSRCCLK